MTTQAKEQDASAMALRAGEHLTRGANELYALGFVRKVGFANVSHAAAA